MHIKIIRFLAAKAAILVLLSVFASAGYGQVATGGLTGTVTDAKGAAMAGVTVTVHNAGTGVDTIEKSNDSGIYSAPLLQPGTYDIIASQTGFATVQNKGIALEVGATVRIDITLPVASQQSLVTVTTEAPVLETEKTDQSQNVSESLVTNLPTSSRRWEQFVLLTPGVQPDGVTGGISFHGINSLYNNNSVDGANNNNSYVGGARGSAITASADGYVYSGDSIQEFQVESGSFSAEVGQSAGGAVNAVTKSGTNNLHGDLFYNVRNAVLNASDPVAKINASVNPQVPTVPVHQQNQWGGSVGGPIIKDKLFFFVTDDGYRKNFPNVVTTAQLSPAINSPLFVCPSEITVAQCAAAKNYVLTQDIGGFPQFIRQDVEFVKLDYQMNSANHLSGVANIRDWRNPVGGLGNASIHANQTDLQDRFAIGNWTSVISTNKINELRYQWGVDAELLPVPNVGGAPSVGLSNLFTYGSNNGSGHNPVEIRNQISDNFSWTKGTHSIKIGVDVNLIAETARSATQSAGAYTYSSAVTGALSTAQFTTATGCGATASGGTQNIIFCDWLLDLYRVNIGDGRTGTHWSTFNQTGDSAGFPVGSPNIAPGFEPPDGSVPPNTFLYKFNTSDYAGYVQDTWKARPNLTVNLGLRYDAELFPSVLHANTLTPYLTSVTSAFPADYGGIQPRIGVAYNFAKHTVLRVGGGLFVAKTNGSLFKAFIAGATEAKINCNPTGAGACSTIASAPFLFPDLLFNQQDVLPSAPFSSTTLGGANGSQPVSPAVLTPSTDICPCGIRGIDPGVKRPRAYEAQVAIEQQLPGNMSLSATYVLTRGDHLPSTADANILNNNVTKSYDVVNSAGATQLVSTVPFFTTRLEPIVGPIIATFAGVNSWYNGLVLTLHKPMSHGIEVLVNYTYSKATDDGQAGNNEGGESFFPTDGVINPFNQKGEQGLSETDAPNRFTASLVWEPTYAKGSKSRLVRGLANGWNLSSTITATNGTRYSGAVQSTAAQCLVVASTCPAGDLALQGGMSGADISTSGSSIGGHIAWLPRDSFALPSYSDIDLRLTRQFAIRERYFFEFRAEAFNLFNSTIVQAVNENAFTFTAPSSTSTACPSSLHTNTCMTPVAAFQTPTTTTGLLLGSRQLQFGFRFSF